MRLDSTYWNDRYQDDRTGWDIGAPSPPLMDFIRTCCNKQDRILIPGGGNGWEAAKAYQEGYKQVFVIDWAPHAKGAFTKRFPFFPEEQYFCENFFTHHGQYDVILEQTFFCALDPSLRKDYVRKMHSLLREKGTLAGVLFGVEMTDGPPFGGSKEEYQELFQSKFYLVRLEDCANSIPPRQGRELFFRLSKIS